MCERTYQARLQKNASFIWGVSSVIIYCLAEVAINIDSIDFIDNIFESNNEISKSLSKINEPYIILALRCVKEEDQKIVEKGYRELMKSYNAINLSKVRIHFIPEYSMNNEQSRKQYVICCQEIAETILQLETKFENFQMWKKVCEETLNSINENKALKSHKELSSIWSKEAKIKAIKEYEVKALMQQVRPYSKFTHESVMNAAKLIFREECPVPYINF